MIPAYGPVLTGEMFEDKKQSGSTPRALNGIHPLLGVEGRIDRALQRAGRADHGDYVVLLHQFAARGGRTFGGARIVFDDQMDRPPADSPAGVDPFEHRLGRHGGFWEERAAGERTHIAHFDRLAGRLHRSFCRGFRRGRCLRRGGSRWGFGGLWCLCRCRRRGRLFGRGAVGTVIVVAAG